MSRDSKRKLAIVAGISECLVYAEAKYCAFEIHGEPKYYVCPRTEYCCNFGCCVSPGFQIYHLWYYWLLVIIMFLVCSGGGWWYRYWLQGRFRAAASAIPNRGTQNSRGQNTLPGRTCPAQQASITYNSARNTVLLHRMWKGGPHRGPGSSPAYAGPPATGATSSAAHFQNTSVVLNDVNCPYYQLYGPPPSYETVIAQTRGKLSSPLSPERSRNDLPAGATSTSTLQNQDVPPSRCYNHSPYNGGNGNNHPSQIGGNVGGAEGAVPRYEQSANVADTIHRLDAIEASAGFARTYAPSYASNGELATPVHTAGRHEACLPPLHYHGGPIPTLDYQETRESGATGSDGYRMYRGDEVNLERLPSYHGERSELEARPRRTNGTSSTTRDHQRAVLSEQLSTGESHSSVPDLNIGIGEFYSRRGREGKALSREDQRYIRGAGGSLKYSRMPRDDLTSRRGGPTYSELGTPVWSGRDRTTALIAGTTGSTAKDCTRVELDLGDVGALFSRSTRKGLLENEHEASANRQDYERQTNPSENVILEPLTSVNIKDDTTTAEVIRNGGDSSRWRTRPRDDEDPAGSPASNNYDEGRSLVLASINNHESKHKLDRSKSLD